MSLEPRFDEGHGQGFHEGIERCFPPEICESSDWPMTLVAAEVIP
jgi:hypothetical protein